MITSYLGNIQSVCFSLSSLYSEFWSCFNHSCWSVKILHGPPVKFIKKFLPLCAHLKHVVLKSRNVKSLFTNATFFQILDATFDEIMPLALAKMPDFASMPFVQLYFYCIQNWQHFFFHPAWFQISFFYFE